MAFVDNPQDLPPPYSPSDPHNPAPSIASQQSSTTDVATINITDPPAAQAQPIQNDGRRNLLLIYVHGFMGNETSFHSFPIHVHNMVSALLSQSHVVQTKIYPKYRSKKSIDLAIGDLSEWLRPHESEETDVILLGHSMGGLLTAEIALKPGPNRTTQPLMHRLIGTIAFDTPFLGMHPGIIKAGIGSLFRPDPNNAPNSTESLNNWPLDTNFNPPFFNDVQLPVRNAWRNAAHFVNKHSNQLAAATKQLVVSHIQFGQCLADFSGLKVRYCKIRILEEDEPLKRKGVVESENPPPRVRFVNYYTASTGRMQNLPAAEMERKESISTFNTHDIILERGPPMHPEKQPLPAAEGSPEGSEISDLTELDTLDDLESNFDDTLSIMDDATETSSITTSIASYPSLNSRPSVSSTRTAAEPPPPFPGPMNSSFPPEKGQAPRVVSDDPPEGPSAAVEISQSSVEVKQSSGAELIGEPLDFEPEEGPEHPGPIPDPEHFDDPEYYRAVLSDHGAASQQYFKEAKQHEIDQYQKYAKEYYARIANYQAEIHRISVLIHEQSVKGAHALAEHSRITVKLHTDEIRSKTEHRQAVATYKKNFADDISNYSDKKQAKLAEKHGKRHAKLEEKRTKIDRRLEKHRERIAKYQEKVDAKANKDARKMEKLEKRSKSYASSSASGSTEQVLFDATALDKPDGSYDVTTAPISKSIYLIGAVAGSTTSLSSTSTILTPPSTSSQVSIENAYAEPQETRSGSGTDAINEVSKPPPKAVKDRIFCVLPPADASGNRDPCWVRTYMENMDEVGAHTGLFLSRGAGEVVPAGQEWSARYSRLVCDVAERIEQWIVEDLSLRLAAGLDSLDSLD